MTPSRNCCANGIVVLLCHSCSACSSFTGLLRSARLQMSETDCYVIADCRFVSGAWWSDSVALFRGHLLFYNCITTTADSCGCGCGFDANGVTVSRCCGFRCTNPSISQISCLECAPSSILSGSAFLGEYGGLFFEDGTDPTVSRPIFR
jgi:hypothetical protein